MRYIASLLILWLSFTAAPLTANSFSSPLAAHSVIAPFTANSLPYGHDNSTNPAHAQAWTHGSPNTGDAPGFGLSKNGYYYLRVIAAGPFATCEVYTAGWWLIQVMDGNKHVYAQLRTTGTGGRVFITNAIPGNLYMCRISDIGVLAQIDYAEFNTGALNDTHQSDCGGPGVVVDPNFDAAPMEPPPTPGMPINGCDNPSTVKYDATDPRAHPPLQEQYDLGTIQANHTYTLATTRAGGLTAFGFYGHQGTLVQLAITDAQGTIVNGVKWGVQTPNPNRMSQEYVGVDAGVQPAGTYHVVYTGPANSAQHMWALVGGSTLIATPTATVPHGATIYPHLVIAGVTYRGSAWQHREFQATLDQDVAQAVALHLATLRPTDYLDGARSPTDPQVWANMDYLLRIAQANGIHIILDLSAYRNWRKAHALKMYDAAAWKPFIAFVAGRYHGNATIAYYAIAGEIPAVTWTGSPTANQYIAFFGGVAHTIHSIDPLALISTGGLSYLNWRSGIPWQTLEALPDINIVAIHVYSHGDETVTIPLVAAWSVAHGKPWIIEEFGFRQSLGDTARAVAYARIYNEAQMHGAIGAICWNLGPEVLGRSYDVNPQTVQTWAVLMAQQ